MRSPVFSNGSVSAGLTDFQAKKGRNQLFLIAIFRFEFPHYLPILGAFYI